MSYVRIHRSRVPAVTESRSADLPRLGIAGAVFTAVLLPFVLIPLILGGEHGRPWWTYVCFALSAAGNPDLPACDGLDRALGSAVPLPGADARRAGPRAPHESLTARQASPYASPPGSKPAVPAVASASHPRKASTSASGRAISMVTASP
ncbi:hypothetical protein QF034_001162 [Streptomyces africanus]|uniref:Uncharacterized protein n=1 Tax=Streptomyces africanus TaxID=231024 RepID=A0ABU0QHT1_9ACTN|nr:hypothetical protein [Streptomyces africanus]